MTDQLNELLLIIRSTSEISLPNRFDSWDEVAKNIQKLTYIIWKNEKSLLLNELVHLSDNTYHDVQKFWIECLRWPYKKPYRFTKSGECISDNDYYLKSDFNNYGFHDSLIIHSIREDNKLSLDINLLSFDNNDKLLFNQTTFVFIAPIIIKSYNDSFSFESNLLYSNNSVIFYFDEIPLLYNSSLFTFMKENNNTYMELTKKYLTILYCENIDNCIYYIFFDNYIAISNNM